MRGIADVREPDAGGRQLHAGVPGPPVPGGHREGDVRPPDQERHPDRDDEDQGLGHVRVPSAPSPREDRVERGHVGRTDEVARDELIEHRAQALVGHPLRDDEQGDHHEEARVHLDVLQERHVDGVPERGSRHDGEDEEREPGGEREDEDPAEEQVERRTDHPGPEEELEERPSQEEGDVVGAFRGGVGALRCGGRDLGHGAPPPESSARDSTLGDTLGGYAHGSSADEDRPRSVVEVRLGLLEVAHLARGVPKGEAGVHPVAAGEAPAVHAEQLGRFACVRPADARGVAHHGDDERDPLEARVEPDRLEEPVPRLRGPSAAQLDEAQQRQRPDRVAGPLAVPQEGQRLRGERGGPIDVAREHAHLGLPHEEGARELPRVGERGQCEGSAHAGERPVRLPQPAEEPRLVGERERLLPPLAQRAEGVHRLRVERGRVLEVAEEEARVRDARRVVHARQGGSGPSMGLPCAHGPGSCGLVLAAPELEHAQVRERVALEVGEAMPSREVELGLVEGTRLRQPLEDRDDVAHVAQEPGLARAVAGRASRLEELGDAIPRRRRPTHSPVGLRERTA